MLPIACHTAPQLDIVRPNASHRHVMRYDSETVRVSCSQVVAATVDVRFVYSPFDPQTSHFITVRGLSSLTRVPSSSVSASLFWAHVALCALASVGVFTFA